MTQSIGFKFPTMLFGGDGGGGSGGGGSQNTVQSQQIPAYEQAYSQNNLNLAQGLQSTPFPLYQGQLLQGFTQPQQAAFSNVQNNPNITNPNYAPALDLQAQSAMPFNTQAAQQFMNPYIQQSLDPQLANLNQQIEQQQQQNNAAATMHSAFGDARNGAANDLSNFYGNLEKAQVVGQGYNTAYNSALSAYQQQQQAAQAAGSNISAITNTQQAGGIAGANALYNVGQQQQNFGQQQLSSAYQQFLNQTNWPFQMLNVGESALANNPYTITNYTTLPYASTTAQNLGAFAGLAGALGGAGGATSVFGGGPAPGPGHA